MAKKIKPPQLEPEAPNSYGVASRGEGKAPQIRHTRPEVARHCARMIIRSNMDTQAAVAKMLEADYPDATEAQIVALARTIQTSPYVQREINGLLEEIGYGNEALKKLIGILWAEVLGGNDKRWAAAARLLAEITGAAKAKAQDPKLPRLKLIGMDDGLKEMLGDAAPTDEEPAEGDIMEPEIDVEDDEENAGN